MDSEKDFLKIIIGYYSERNSIKVIPKKLFDDLCKQIARYYHEQYKRFAKEHPKAQKRYSSFMTKDLEHPYTFEIIIRYFKNKVGDNYSGYSMALLNMTFDELKKFEKGREDFYNMF